MSTAMKPISASIHVLAAAILLTAGAHVGHFDTRFRRRIITDLPP